MLSVLLVVAGTRETAFVNAISAAGVAHAVTRACSSGLLDRCGCDRTIEVSRAADGFQWAGCSDNVAYGSAFSKSFVDARERRAKGRDSARALMNLHNNNAGRKVSGCSFYAALSRHHQPHHHLTHPQWRMQRGLSGVQTPTNDNIFRTKI